MGTRRWITSEAIIFHRRDLAASCGPAGAAHGCFTSSLVEGPRALKRHELAALAAAAGAPRTLAHRDERMVANYVREAFRRGDLVAFRRASARPTQAAGTITVTGSFSDQPDARPSGTNANGWDAETKYDLRWAATWKIRRADRQTFVTMNVTAQRLSVRTTYFGDATRSSPHSRHGTLGAHEDLHKRAAQAWWTTANLTTIAGRERIALDLVLPEGMSKAAIKARCQRQLDAIKHFMTALHQHHQESTLDESTAAPPRFARVRR